MRQLLNIVPVLLFSLTFSGCFTPFIFPARPLPRNAIPPRIAVASFENRSDFSGQWNLGDGMSDLLVSELVLSRNFIVLERGSLDKVVDEIRRQGNKLFRHEGKVEKGRLENARYLIRGVITDFSQVSGGSLWVGFKKLLLGGESYKARVAMTLTIVDIESGQIVDSVQCAGSARAGSAYGKAGYKGLRFGGDSFFKTPLGNATSRAMREGLKGIIKKIPRQSWRPMIADVNERQILLNGGKNRKFKVNRYYDVRRKGVPVTDPVTGDLLEILPGEVIGLIRLTEVRKRVAAAEVVEGHGFERGQYLERTSAPEQPSSAK